MSKPKGRSGYERRIIATMPSNVDYESERISYVTTATYTPDFIIYDSAGLPKIYIEAKGYFSPADRRKMLAVKKQHPNLDIRLLFQRPNNKLNKRSRTRYHNWAVKHGFRWAGGDKIPTNWIKEVD